MNSAQIPHIKLYCEHAALLPKAVQLANKYQIEQSQQLDEKSWFLILDPQGLAIVAPMEFHFAPFRLNFHDYGLLKRAKELGKTNSLVKALGARQGEKLLICDATAGLGRDAFLMASLGHQVIMLETHPVLAAMLESAIDCSAESDVAATVARMRLIWTNSAYFLKNEQFEVLPDVIYLDPMFPERTKSALVKKDMQILQHIVGHGQEADSLLNLALQQAKRRVVVKRPRLGPDLAGKKSDLQLLSKTHRFDIYLTR